MNSRNKQSGFSAIELLITLFIAAAFLMSGYQLYGMIIRDSGEARLRAKASNVAYKYLQEYKNTINSDCVATPTPTQEIATIDLLGVTQIIKWVSCPYVSTPSISKVNVVISYNNYSQQVSESTYVNM